ncbi:MAG TPA: hypothetical protein VHW64_10160 [Nocardioides sp.]|uniref:hypothetical protein n=1 Tax=Nocardioides sp. TaxID=35761 RepID=UPI002E334451|nr:hypothetical protein [Nocardioides sp.]HEX3931060.1 hypothetical protein [Nocardioides sp.]
MHQSLSPAVAARVAAATTPSSTERHHVYVNLSTYPDSMAGEHGKDGGANPDWVSYGPGTNIRVPAHSLVTVTISQYDGGEAITNPWFAKVHGTVGGTETVNGKPVTQVDPEEIGHTWTLHAAPTAQDSLFVSAPLPAVPDSAPLAPGSAYPKPIEVTFSFYTKSPGKYVWNCEFPCGDGYYAKFGGPMSTRGYMSGTFTVT